MTARAGEAREGEAREGATVGVLVFELQQHRYAVPARVVAEVVRAVALVPVAGAPRAVEGVFNLRGTIVPAVDVRARFGAPRIPLDPSHHFVIVRLAERLVALRVDRVEALLTIDASRVEPVQASLPSAQDVAGVATLDDGLVVIYDVDAFLSQAEADAFAPVLDAMGASATTGEVNTPTNTDSGIVSNIAAAGVQRGRPS